MRLMTPVAVAMASRIRSHSRGSRGGGGANTMATVEKWAVTQCLIFFLVTYPPLPPLHPPPTYPQGVQQHSGIMSTYTDISSAEVTSHLKSRLPKRFQPVSVVTDVGKDINC